MCPETPAELLHDALPRISISEWGARATAKRSLYDLQFPLVLYQPLRWRNNNDIIFNDAVCHDSPFTSQNDQYEVQWQLPRFRARGKSVEPRRLYSCCAGDY